MNSTPKLSAREAAMLYSASGILSRIAADTPNCQEEIILQSISSQLLAAVGMHLGDETRLVHRSERRAISQELQGLAS